MIATACLDESTVVAFLGGSLPAAERSAVESHLGTCAACAELTTWAAADLAHRSRPAGTEGRPFIGDLAPGDRVDRYQVLGAVGRGGMGEVYAAYHPDLDRRIALKVVHELGANAPEHRARLLREARAIARLSHPNVVSVHDAGTVGDRVYIAMEFVDGETVDAWLRRKPRGWREIVDVFIAAGRGLAAAHAAGVVHRDFKPQNVMVGSDGSVRVMDFGLARLEEEPAERPDTQSAAVSPSIPTTVTKTGAVVGTLAYMAPEQFRREEIDQRADQFSFCVALYESLHGHRPQLSHLAPDTATEGASARSASTPGWLRGVISRGIANNRDQRFPSMGALLRALVAGRTRLRRRASGASVGLAVLLVALGGWRVARGGRISCAVPTDRLAAAWSGRHDERRQSLHRAFTTNGQPSVERSWQRMSAALDEYIAKWSGKYMEACEATHIRGEQSSEILDLRMSCLNDSLDQVRALTDVLGEADSADFTRAAAATNELKPVSWCDDVRTLRSAVPLPRDEKTRTEVGLLRRSLRDVQALADIGQKRAALARGLALRHSFEATRYRPLLAELLEVIGRLQADLNGDPRTAEATMREAFVAAEASRDDAMAAKIASSLVAVHGFSLGRYEDGRFWAEVAEAILERLGPGHERVRGWNLNNYGCIQYLGETSPPRLT